MESLDRLVERRGLGGRRVSFIKLDIEGFEGRALRGSLKTIRRFKPLLLVEMQELASQRAGSSTSELWSFIENLGYSFYLYVPESSSWLPIEQPNGASPNYLAVPRDLPTGTAEALGLGTPRRTDTRR